jgi:transposase
MKKTVYPGDITRQELEQIKPCLNIRRQSKWPLLSIVNAIFYICREGVQWRALPCNFAVPWQTAYWYFQKWTKDDLWQAVNEQLVLVRRQTCGASPLQGSAIIDAQRVANTPAASEQTGVDAGKRTRGRKRLMLTDSAGNLLYVRVFSAHHHDGTAARTWWQDTLVPAPLLQELTVISGDAPFGGRFKSSVEKSSSVKVVTAKEPVSKTRQHLITIHKKRRVVERTIAWETTSRRLARDYERKPAHSEAFCLISSITRMLKNPVALN